MILYHDVLYKCKFIKTLSGTTILAKKMYERHPRKLILNIRGADDLVDDTETSEWINSCFDHYENRFEIARAIPVSSRRQPGIARYRVDIILDNNISLNGMLAAYNAL
jgi:hypothetical protein